LSTHGSQVDSDEDRDFLGSDSSSDEEDIVGHSRGGSEGSSSGGGGGKSEFFAAGEESEFTRESGFNAIWLWKRSTKIILTEFLDPQARYQKDSESLLQYFTIQSNLLLRALQTTRHVQLRTSMKELFSSAQTNPSSTDASMGSIQIDSPSEKVDDHGVNSVNAVHKEGVQGIAVGLALKNVSAESNQDLMFMIGERVVLLERLGNGLCMGYCEGVMGQFKEEEVDFFSQSSSLSLSTSPNSPSSLQPTNNRSRANSSTLIADNEVIDADSSMTRDSFIPSTAISGNPIDKPGPRKPASDDNLKTSTTTAVTAARAERRRQIISSPPVPHPELIASTLVIPPRSSSRQSNSNETNSQNYSSRIQSLGTKSSSSSINSFTDQALYGSPATMIANSLEIKTNDFMTLDSNRLSPIPFQHQKLKASQSSSSLSSSPSSSRKNSTTLEQSPVPSTTSPAIVSNNIQIQTQSIQSITFSSGNGGGGGDSIQSPVSPTTLNKPNCQEAPHPLEHSLKKKQSNSSLFQSRRPSQGQDSEKDERHREHDNYLTSVLEDIRSKTSKVLQLMSPTASLYKDHGTKEVDLRVVQMPPSMDQLGPPNVSLSTATSSPIMLENATNMVSSDPQTINMAISPNDPNRPDVVVRNPSKGTDEKPPTGRNRSRSQSIRSQNRPPKITTTTSLSDNSSLAGDNASLSSATSPTSGLHSMFEKFRPWVKSDQRQRSNSGPAWHFDSTPGQQLQNGEFGLQPPLPHEQSRVPRQRRISEATVVTTTSAMTSYSQRHRSKNWFGMSRKGSTSGPIEDMRKPHPLGNGIEGGISNPHMLGSLMDEYEDEDSDGVEDDDDEEESEGKKNENGGVAGKSRMFINDYGFIYDLDDEINQGQDLTGTGSNATAGGTSSMGSNVSSLLEPDRRKANRRLKDVRDNEFKWIHAVTNLHVDSVKKSTKYKKLARRGVPPSVRGRVWLFLAKADMYRRPGLFEELCKRGPLPIHEVIERDIHRCYPDHVHFRDGMGGTGQQDLHAILKAYAHYKPSVGYCQGMGRLVGMMLMQMPVEDAFWLLVATIEGYMQDYYTPSLRQLRIDAQVFERLLKDQDPALAEHLAKNDVIPLMYMTQWFMTLYTMSLPWASVLLVWDVFYYDGVKALFRVGLAILHLCRDHLLHKCPSSSELLAYMLHIPLDILAAKPLLEAALHIRLKRQSVQKLIAVTA
ncbi:hypothetical protein BGZ76_003354, partial [Entomortierella beljakovae]